MLFLRADLSLADARVYFALSKDPRLIEIARKSPTEFDVHKFVGSLIFGEPEENIKGEKRQVSKKVSHGSAYDMAPDRMSDTLIKDGYFYTPEECAVMQARYHAALPAIREGYQFNTRMLIIRERKLVNSWGRVIYFRHERFEPSVYRRGYAWRAASEVADILNQWGFIPLDQFIERNNLKSRINMQVHDEVLVSVTRDEAWDIARFLRDSIEREREYDGISLKMPVTFAVERRYHTEEVEFKRLPDDKAEWDAKFDPLWETRIK